MKYAQKHEQAEPKQLEPWQIILANYGRNIPNAEFQAKWESGIDLEWKGNKGQWEDVTHSPAEGFATWVEFREKPNTKKHKVWCVDYMDTLGNIAIQTFKSKQEALEIKMPDDYKVLSGPYLKEYTL